ncbi:MAG: hypothetical protein ACYCOU_20200, partial [Sulfobacillus sp.]
RSTVSERSGVRCKSASLTIDYVSAIKNGDVTIKVSSQVAGGKLTIYSARQSQGPLVDYSTLIGSHWHDGQQGIAIINHSHI